MHPVLVEIGGIRIYAYGVFVALGFLAAIAVAGREVGRKGLDRERFYDMAFWVVLAGIAGARLFHILVYLDFYAANPREIYRLWNGGLVYYGGLLLAIVVAFAYLRRHRIPFLPIADASALGIPLGIAFGRIGCTFAGCCYGKPTSLPWGIVFSDPGSLAPLHVPLHPTQPYESLAAFALFGVLYATRDRFRIPGTRFWTMLILYGVARSALELFRDDPRGFVGPFSESQLVSAALAAYAVLSILRARKAARGPA